jgi:hypothetical protein
MCSPKTLTHLIGSVAVPRGRGFGIDAEGDSWVGMTEANLCSLHIDPFGHKRRGRVRPEVVKVEPRQSSRLGGGQPDPPTPVRVVEGLPLGGDENQSCRISGSQATMG